MTFPGRLALIIPAAFLFAASFASSVQAQAAAEEKAVPPQGNSATPAATPAATKDKPAPTALPPDAHIDQTAVIDGKPLKYTATVSTLPVRNPEGKTVADVVLTAYTVSGTDRPVTFAFNGGPGASSVYLNFGAIGPKRVQFGAEGDSPSDTPLLRDNPGSWLDLTDLVFIDPVGTGFSRSDVPEAEAKKLFFTPTSDVEYLSRIVYDWLVKNGRLMSRKYLIGESYGGFRGPRVTHYLQSQLGIALNGVVLVSPYLNPSQDENENMSPLPWMMTLPSIAAANLERQHKLTPAAMADVIAYTRGEYATDLLKGRSDPQATPRIVKRVTELTGLAPEFVQRSGGRIETRAYLREIHRGEGRIGSVYDSNVTGFDPYPYVPESEFNDPILESIVAPLTTAMVDFVTRTVGWKVEARYNALSYDVNRQWDRGGMDLRSGSVPALRQAVAADPKIRVLIAHGWNDLSCPFMGSVLTVDAMPAMGDASRVAVREYAGGHMFYTRPDSQKELKADARELFQKH